MSDETRAGPGPDPSPDPSTDKTPERAPDVVRSRFDRGVVRVAQFAAWLVFIAMAISVYEVIMRYGFGAPTSWVHETVVMLVAVSFCLGGPRGVRNTVWMRKRDKTRHASKSEPPRWHA